MFFKLIENDVLTMIGSQDVLPTDAIEITEEEYNELYANIMDSIEPIEPTNPYGIEDELYDSIIDDYTMMLIEEGVIE